MQIRQNITPAVLGAVTALLQPYAPELSPRSLVDALKAYETKKNESDIQRPLTRAEAAALLQCSLNTISRYLSCGKLKRIKLTERSCRIDADSVRALLTGSATVEG